MLGYVNFFILMWGRIKTFFWHPTKSSGFTLIEILIATSIAALILSVGGTRYLDFNKTQLIKGAGLVLKNNLRDIQAKALAGVKPAVAICTDPTLLNHYRVTFASSTTYNAEAYCIEEDGDLVASGVSVTYTLPDTVIFNGSIANIEFKVLGKGATSSVNDITIRNEGALLPSTKWYSLCVSRSGDIKDCGYKVSATAPSCSCS